MDTWVAYVNVPLYVEGITDIKLDMGSMSLNVN